MRQIDLYELLLSSPNFEVFEDMQICLCLIIQFTCFHPLYSVYNMLLDNAKLRQANKKKKPMEAKRNTVLYMTGG